MVKTSSKRNLLVIAPFNIFPPYWGAADRCYNIITQFSKYYGVTFLYTDYCLLREEGNKTIPNVRLQAVGPSSKITQLFNPFLLSTGLRIIRRDKPRFILAEFLWSGAVALLLSRLTKVPYILDEHNVECVRFYRMGSKFSYLLKVYEILLCKHASRIFCVSDTDKNFLVKLGISPTKVLVVPNGVDPKRFVPNKNAGFAVRAKLGLVASSKIVLFFGKLDYKPNRDALVFIYSSLLPAVTKVNPNVKFLIVGANPPQIKDESLIFTGAVENIEAYINAADLVIVPLATGGGTRLKILQSIACGKSVLSTRAGAEGLDLANLQNFLEIVPFEDFAEWLLRFITKRRVSAQPRGIIKKYGWSVPNPKNYFGVEHEVP